MAIAYFVVHIEYLPRVSASNSSLGTSVLSTAINLSVDYS